MAPDLAAGAAEVALDLAVAEARPTAIRSKAAVICGGPGRWSATQSRSVLNSDEVTRGSVMGSFSGRACLRQGTASEKCGLAGRVPAGFLFTLLAGNQGAPDRGRPVASTVAMRP